MKYLSEALQINTVLTTLELGCQNTENIFANLGIEYLSNALKENQVLYHILSIFCVFMFVLLKTLKKLDLSYNEIGKASARYLADALRTNQVTRSFQK